MKLPHWKAVLIASLLVVLSTPSTNGAGPIDFTVSAPAEGRTFTLSQAKGKYVALHFLLKTECPYCLKHTRDYAMKAGTTTDVLHLFLKPDREEEIKTWAGKLNRGEGFPPITLYRDVDAMLAEAYGVPGGYAFHGESVHYPALILLDPAGKEVFRYIGTNNADRLPFDRFVARLAMLKEKPAALDHYNLGKDKLALGGYDPVTYFTEGKALKGRIDLRANHRGVTYQFSSEETRKLFLNSPETYLPTYGGWCATAMAKGEKVEVDPTNFKVTQGRLFLFFKAFYANAIKDWNKDEARLTVKADSNWHQFSGE